MTIQKEIKAAEKLYEVIKKKKIENMFENDEVRAPLLHEVLSILDDYSVECPAEISVDIDYIEGRKVFEFECNVEYMRIGKVGTWADGLGETRLEAAINCLCNLYEKLKEKEINHE